MTSKDRLSNSEFVNEMSILWQNLPVRIRGQLGRIIRAYFNHGERADLIIERMQETIKNIRLPMSKHKPHYRYGQTPAK